MTTRDPRVDAYIAAAAPFARPILEHLRDLVHRAVPDVQESIKWGMPFFECRGIVCHMAAFKAHAAFGLAHADTVLSDIGGPIRDGMGAFGKLTRVQDLPASRVLASLIKRAAALNANQRATTRVTSTPRTGKALRVPHAIRAALSRDAVAWSNFSALAPSHKREYVEWITEAKRDVTAQRRIAQAIVWLRDGKRRNWKYER